MGFVKTRRVFQCNPCHKQVSVTAGTMFHQSHIPLQKWFWAIFLMATSSKGISMLNLRRHLGIKSYQAVWLMGHKIRHAMIQREGLYQLKGKVQVDPIHIGTQNLENRREIRENRNSQFLMGVQEGRTKNYPRFVTFEQLASGFKEEILPALEKRIANLKKIAGISAIVLAALAAILLAAALAGVLPLVFYLKIPLTNGPLLLILLLWHAFLMSGHFAAGLTPLNGLLLVIAPHLAWVGEFRARQWPVLARGFLRFGAVFIPMLSAQILAWRDFVEATREMQL